MKTKILFIVVVVLSIVACSIMYFVYSEYSGYKENEGIVKQAKISDSLKFGQLMINKSANTWKVEITNTSDKSIIGSLLIALYDENKNLVISETANIGEGQLLPFKTITYTGTIVGVDEKKLYTYEVSDARLSYYDYVPEIATSNKKEQEDLAKEKEDSSVREQQEKVKKQEIYDYAVRVFFEITNDGDTYVPEVHDSRIATITAKKFGITPEEVMEIQIEIGMNMYK